MSKLIPLSKGKFAIVDDADFEWLNQWKWHYTPGGKTGYAVRSVRVEGHKSPIQLHRVLLNAPPDLDVDHINGDGLDDQRTNLRLATGRQNQGNSPARFGTSAYKGVYLHRETAWVAKVGGTHIGHFPTQWEAAQAYNKAAIEYFGEFARLNEKFPDTILEDAPLYDIDTRMSSRYKGVSYQKDTNKWQSYISVNKKRTWLGQFETELEAARVYDDFIKEHNLNRKLNITP